MRLLGVVLGSVTFAVPVTATLIDLFGYVAKVEGVSMQPVLNPQGDGRTAVDYVFLNRWAIRTYQFQRGEIVSMTSPFNPDQKIIKRIVALEGDTVKTLAYKDSVVRVPAGYCWVEGDHHQHSMDSNFFGPVAQFLYSCENTVFSEKEESYAAKVSLALISAKASHIVWPPARWQKLRVQTKDDQRFSVLGSFLDA